jgi:hypothetical protein
MSDQADPIINLVDVGSELAGTAATGVAIALLQPGPDEALMLGLTGVGLTHALRWVGTEIAERWLGRREKIRIGAAYTFALAKVRENMESGRQIRQDGFFQERPDERTDGEEILEGVLLTAQREHEEKKLKYIGNIFANVAFMPEVSAAQANWLLQRARELTYRQLCILALTQRKERKNPSYGPKDGDPAFEMEYRQLMDMFSYDETIESYRRGHIDDSGGISRVTGLDRIGMLCYTVMGLDEIPEDDLRRLLAPRFHRAFE